MIYLFYKIESSGHPFSIMDFLKSGNEVKALHFRFYFHRGFGDL